jgi:hypothetical protein
VDLKKKFTDNKRQNQVIRGDDLRNSRINLFKDNQTEVFYCFLDSELTPVLNGDTSLEFIGSYDKNDCEKNLDYSLAYKNFTIIDDVKDQNLFDQIAPGKYDWTKDQAPGIVVMSNKFLKHDIDVEEIFDILYLSNKNKNDLDKALKNRKITKLVCLYKKGTRREWNGVYPYYEADDSHEHNIRFLQFIKDIDLDPTFKFENFAPLVIKLKNNIDLNLNSLLTNFNKNEKIDLYNLLAYINNKINDINDGNKIKPFTENYPDLDDNLIKFMDQLDEEEKEEKERLEKEKKKNNSRLNPFAKVFVPGNFK